MTMGEVKAYLKHYATQAQKLDSREYDPTIHSLLATILKKLDDIESQKGDLEKIIPHSIILVETIDKLIQLATSEVQKRDIVLPVNKALQHIHNLYDVDPLK